MVPLANLLILGLTRTCKENFMAQTPRHSSPSEKPSQVTCRNPQPTRARHTPRRAECRGNTTCTQSQR